MPAKLPPEVQQAMDSPPAIPTQRDLQEMINQERQKEAAAKEATKEEAKPAAKEEPKKLAKEDTAKATELLAKRLGFDRPSKDEKKAGASDDKELEKQKGDDEKAAAAKPDATAKEPEDKGAAKTGAEAEAKEESPKKGKVSKKKEIDPVEIATHAATRAAQEVLQSTDTRAREEQRAPVQKPLDDAALSDEERQELTIFKEMAESDPAFKALPNQYLTYLKKAESYQRNWEKEHPGEEFDPEADEHDKFFKTAEPKYSQRDFAKAEARIEARALIAKERETNNKETAALRADLAVRELEPNIRNTQIGATAEIIKTVNEDWLKTIEKDGFQKFAESNPMEADIIQAVAKNIGPFIAAAIAIDDPKGRVPINQNDPAHREWADYLTAKENALRMLPISERKTDDGRIIISRQEYASLPPNKRAAYAYYDAEQLINMRVAEEAERVQEHYEKEQKRIEAIAKARGWTKVTEQAKEQTEKNGEPPKPPKPEEKREEVRSPEAASSARVDTSNTTQAIGGNEFSERLSAVLFRRP